MLRVRKNTVIPAVFFALCEIFHGASGEGAAGFFFAKSLTVCGREKTPFGQPEKKSTGRDCGELSNRGFPTGQIHTIIVVYFINCAAVGSMAVKTKRGLQNMKLGLVLEGGAMRGIYTAGVLDAFMQAGVRFDGVIGVSAGALFGVNYLSGQIGRAVRYNKKYNQDKNYMGLLPLLKTGNVIDTHYAYEKVPRELDPFDDEAFRASPVPFYAAITNMRTGQAEYPRITSVFAQMDVLRASGSMPFLSRPVPLGEELYMDGAVADSIPFEKMAQLGYDRLVVVLTKPAGYRKKPISSRLTAAVYGKKYPRFAVAVRRRHIMYNAQLDRLAGWERQDRVQVLRPSRKMDIGRTEKNPEKIEAMYQLGLQDARQWLAMPGAFVNRRESL